MTDEYQSIPVAVARAAVLESGEREALAGPFFLASVGDAPAPFFIPTEETPHPVAGYVTIKRRGHEPRDVWLPWGEYAEELKLNDPDWHVLRGQKPMTIFGAEIEVQAYRREFADVLAKLTPVAPQVMPAQPWEAPTVEPARDWLADLAAATSKSEVDVLFEEARAAKALKDAGLHEAFTRRLREVLARPKPTEAAREIVVETVAAAEVRVPETRMVTVPSPAVVAAKVKPLAVNPPRRPQGERPQGERPQGQRRRKHPGGKSAG